MDKTQMLNELENAKKTHLAQMQKIKDVLNNKDVQNPTPIGKMDCECGEWFYTHREQLQHILGEQMFIKLDDIHERWHKEYGRIYDIFFKEEKKKGFFAKILGANKVDTMLIDKAKLYYVELEEITKELLKSSEVAIRRVSALQESKFK